MLTSYELDSTSATYLFDKMHSADVRIQEKSLTISSCYLLVRNASENESSNIEFEKTHSSLLQINGLIDGTESVTSNIRVVLSKLNLNLTLCNIEIISKK